MKLVSSEMFQALFYKAFYDPILKCVLWTISAQMWSPFMTIICRHYLYADLSATHENYNMTLHTLLNNVF